MEQLQPIRIMRIIARLNVGGPALQVILLHEHLVPPDFESLLVCGQIDPHEGDMRYLANEKGITPVVIPDLGRSISPIRDLITIVKLYRLMRQYKPHIVHTHTAKAGFVGRVAAWLARVPVRVHTFHGHVFHGYFGTAKTQLFLQLERWCTRISTRLITISPLLREELVTKYGIGSYEKFEIVPLGLDLNKFASVDNSQNIREQYGLPLSAKLIGIVGRLVDVKNHGLFLDAAVEILKHRQDIHFVIVGDGELRPQLEQQVIDNNLQPYVSFIGWVENLAPLLHELSVLALTSNNEGTPVSIIEAMAAGVPVVATSVGGVPDVLDHGRLGTLIHPQNAQLFAKGTIRVLEGQHPDLQIAQSTALELYNIHRLADNLSTLYRQLLR